MFEKGREEIVKSGSSETIVGASVKLKGNLKSDGDVLIEGVVTGDLKTKGSVKVGEAASVVANVKAENIVIAGSVQGNIEIKDRLEITSTGRVVGDIVTNVLSIAPGAVFTGKCSMPDSPRDEVVEPTAEIEETEEEKEEK
ncbi:MAG: polymer-forming cytoskeletal protein [Patescibacteria group bacterium]|nr:polymer-forming cytoskeletal protein [Patescibacteria group bacterium]